MQNPHSPLNKRAQKYVWWTKLNGSEDVNYLICQMMNFGTFDDVLWLRNNFSGDQLKHALVQSKLGQLSPKSFNYWAHVLNCHECDIETGTEKRIPVKKGRTFESP